MICASTGNTSAAAAAYAARAGMKAYVLIPEGKIALGKLAQAIVLGATVIQIEGNFDDGMRIVKDIGKTTPGGDRQLHQPLAPAGAEDRLVRDRRGTGAARRTTTRCRSATPAISPPTGSATPKPPGTEHWPVLFCDGQCPVQRTLVLCNTRPVMIGYQAAGAAPFMRGSRVADPETLATAIRIGDPQSWDRAWVAQRESGGWFDELTDDEILSAQARLAATDGIFCEPASAASIAGVMRDIASGQDPPGLDGGLHADRQRPERPRYRHPQRPHRPSTRAGRAWGGGTGHRRWALTAHFSPGHQLVASSPVRADPAGPSCRRCHRLCGPARHPCPMSSAGVYSQRGIRRAGRPESGPGRPAPAGRG